MALTDVAIRALKSGDSVTKLSDGGGLQLWVTPAGGKLWRLAYRFGGKQKKLSIGTYPDVSLAAAREQREDAKRLLASGVDPGQRKQAAKREKANIEAIEKANTEATFDAIAAELMAKKRKEEKATATLDKNEWYLSLVRPAIGARPIADLTAPDVLEALRPIEESGRLETARRLRALVGQVFRLAVATGRAANDPTFALRGALAAPKVKHRAAITDPKALGGLLRAIDGFEGQPTTVAALKLLAYLFPRPGELRAAEWCEFDLEGAVWTIPAARTKMRRTHKVPLPTQALAILRDLKAITGRGALVFPGFGLNGGGAKPVKPRPISENTLNGAIRRMGFTSEEMTAHGFRATASTLLNESGRYSVAAIERALAHQDADSVRRAYARGEHWIERVEMAQWWADYLDLLSNK